MPEHRTNQNEQEPLGNDGPLEVITTHLNADFDALASMLAASKLYPDAVLVFPGSQEKGLRNFFLHSVSYVLNLTKIRHVDISRVTRLILVDTRQKSRIGKFAELVERPEVEIHIYDHHPPSEDDIKGDVEYVKELGAAASLLAGLLKERGVTLTPDEATIMTLGIHEDTGSFTFSSTKPDDYRAAAWLAEQGASQNLVADLLTRELTAEQVWLLNDLTKAAITHSINGVEVVISNVVREEYVGDFAVLVHKFMEMENLDVIFALAQMEDKVYLVARSRINEVNAAEVALAFGGGGHPQAASATIKNQTLIQVQRSLEEFLWNHINPRRTARDIMTSPVIQVSPDATIQKAATDMTRYNINVLLVTDHEERIQGYVTRQVVEKAVFFGLGYLPVREYMNIEYSAVGPEAGLKELQDLIIKNKLRILPVVENGLVLGVITRTDLLNILVGEPAQGDFLYDFRHDSGFVRKKNMSTLLRERLPQAIIQYLKEYGLVADSMGYNVFLVGGLVRDVILKRENLDVDLVVEGDGIKLAYAYARRHPEVRVRAHRKFGTAVIVHPNGFKVDVATARIEYYESPAAPPIVETSSLKQDLYRRDFTMNTLAVKLNPRHFGTLVDYFGAQKDIKERAIRVLHNLSFVEDPTRVLRAIRFEQRFGFKIGKLTLALMKNAVAINTFKDMSARRIFLELKLLLMENEPLRAVKRMDEFDLLKLVFPGLKLTPKLLNLLQEIEGVLSWFQRLYLEEPYQPWKVYFLGLTSPMSDTKLAELAARFQISEQEGLGLIKQRARTQQLAEGLYRLPEGDNYGVFALLSQYDTEVILYTMAKAPHENIKRKISHYFTRLRGTRTALGGKDLIKMGIQPGPVYREILDQLLKARMNEVLRNEEDEIRFVKKHYPHLMRESKKDAPSGFEGEKP
ncbi:MAG: CBS domain-containing protein [Desulfobacteraceae bacterium]